MTFAGTGTPGYNSNQDGGPAIDAQLDFPDGVAVDDKGTVDATDDEVFIADRVNDRVRKVDVDGDISTVAGTGTPCSSSIDPCGDGMVATAAQLGNPTGLAVFDDEVFITDTFNHRVRKVDVDGIISTIAGNGMRGFSGDGGLATAAQLNIPHDVTVSARGDELFIAEWGNHRVRKVDANGIISTVAGTGTPCSSSTASCGDGGVATAAQLLNPRAVTVSGSGELFIAEFGIHRVRKLTPA